MCGILVVIRKDGGEPETALFKEALRYQDNRGPDGTSMVRPANNIAFGFNRLAIQGLTQECMQPIQAGSTTLIFNGEVYNKAELDTTLDIDSSGDAQTLVEGLEQDGRRFITQCNSIHALCYHTEDRIVVSRDRLGVKPLYYCEDKNHAIISSDIKSFQAYMDLSVNGDQLARSVFLDWTITQSPQGTFFESVEKIPSATNVILSHDGEILESEQYWRRSFDTRTTYPQTEFNHRLETVFDYETTSDTPIGIILSGGIDTTTNAAFSLPYLDDQETTNLYTFYHDEDEPDKASAEATANHLRKNHDVSHHLLTFHNKMTYEDFLRTTKELCWPVLDIRFITFQKLFGEVDEKVVLSGMGADEVYYGYYELKHWFSEIFHVDFDTQTTMKLYQRINKGKYDYLNCSFLDKAKTTTKDFLNEQIQRVSAPTKEQRITAFLGNVYLPHVLELEDKSSMAHSVESRVPLINSLLVDYGDKHKHLVHIERSRSGRSMFRNALNGRLPEEIRQRKKRPTPRKTNILPDLREILKRKEKEIKANPLLKKIYEASVLNNVLSLSNTPQNKFFGDIEHLYTEIIGIHAFTDYFDLI